MAAGPSADDRVSTAAVCSSAQRTASAANWAFPPGK